jgi:hypothetical protein
MCSIEKITSKTTKIKYPDANKPNGYGEKEVKMYMIKAFLFIPFV